MKRKKHQGQCFSSCKSAQSLGQVTYSDLLFAGRLFAA